MIRRVAVPLLALMIALIAALSFFFESHYAIMMKDKDSHKEDLKHETHVDAHSSSSSWVSVSSLHPTQLACGLQQVHAKKVVKLEKKASKSASKLEHFLLKNSVPVVVGPRNSQANATDTPTIAGASHNCSAEGHAEDKHWMYILDHHHLTLASCLANIGEWKGRVAIHIVKNMSESSEEEFWAYMQENNYIWPFTHNGTQLPMNGFLRQLPTSLGGLKDDPYRSLAAILREADGFEKDWTPFSEFRWANFLRSTVPIDPEKGPDHPDALAASLLQAKSEQASHLPGYKSSSHS